MKDSKHKILTLAALTTIAAGIVHISNRVIVASSQLKEMLDFSNHNYYNWRFGKIYYTKKGSGSPLLLIHDTMPGGSGYEWSRVEDQLALEHTVYTIDLLGCGRSEKAGITYTNFLFVQIICDFIKNVIKEKTDIIASGFSCSFVTTAAAYDKENINKIMFINPVSLVSLSKTPTQKDKIFKFLVEIPVFGTLIYHIIVSRETISDLFLDNLYYNPFHADRDIMDAYYEAAHKGGYYAKYLYSSQSAKYMNINIRHALESLDNSIYIVEGEDEPNGNSIVDDYLRINPAIETAVISCSKHFPHIENAEGFLEQVGTFFASEK
jgi:pimeloyl-ACP methyl ester carboxylesterase